MNVEVGEVYENPRCGERVVIRTPAAENGGARTVMDVYAKPGGAVSGEHVHPVSEERFTLVRGKVAFLIGGRPVTLDEPGQSVLIQPGIKHRWWNCSGEESFHICEVRKNSDRFEQLVLRQLFGLAQDGKTSPEGMPKLLQQAVTTMEFSDVVRFTNTPWPVQRVLFGALAPVARLLGHKGCDPRYMNRKPSERVELEKLPDEVLAHHY
ncbi:cupin domain-containing protein [Streptomyces niger]|uniref:cupin domain-containing protein n=1 Tax=Streptomyces niger TaxID=66373 RepID=UPI00069A5E4F|nr:cupin domain-containing protein [Streptomyces niger]